MYRPNGSFIISLDTRHKNYDTLGLRNMCCVSIGADSTGARGIFAPLLLKVGGQKYHFAPLLSGNFNINVYQTLTHTWSYGAFWTRLAPAIKLMRVQRRLASLRN